MGRDKLLLPWGETTVLGTLLSAWRASRVDDVVVVTRADQEAVSTICESSGVSLVVPDAPPPHMKDSVHAALEHIRSQFKPDERDVWLLAPADMPLLNPALIDRVLAAHTPATPSIVVPIQAGKRGHPVLFPWRLADEVAQLGSDEGINVLRTRHPVVEIECEDERIHRDLDTPEDYESLRRREGRAGLGDE